MAVVAFKLKCYKMNTHCKNYSTSNTKHLFIIFFQLKFLKGNLGKNLACTRFIFFFQRAYGAKR
jgi:hypothetical protein